MSHVLESGTRIAEVPSDVVIRAGDGIPCESAGTFWITTRTLDPYHVLIDLQDPRAVTPEPVAF